MQALIMIGSGIGLLAIMVVGARFCRIGNDGHMAETARLFVPIWLVIAGINMGIGVFSGAAPLLSEAVVLMVVFGVPAALAVWVARRLDGI